MGLGLPGAVGLALAKKLKGEEGKVYVLMSDGEMAIGTTWEAMNIAFHHGLDNLYIIIDCNGFQAMGRVEEVLGVEKLDCQHEEVDGHNYEEVEKAIGDYYDGPIFIYANTIKGKGVSFMENNNLWHYAQIKPEDYVKAMGELTYHA